MRNSQPRKIYQGDYVIHPEKEIPHKTYRPFWREENYEGDTNEKIRNTDDSWSENDDYVKTWTKKYIIDKMINE